MSSLFVYKFLTLLVSIQFSLMYRLMTSGLGISGTTFCKLPLQHSNTQLI